MNALVCLGRHTVTGLIMTGGDQFSDWSLYYRFFSQERYDVEQLFSVVRREVLTHLPPECPLVVAMDDSIFRKRGRKIPGVAFQRDPMSPPFHVNFILGQRFLQVSAAVPGHTLHSPARMVPLDFCLCPTPKKPAKQAPKELWDEYDTLKKEMRLSRQGVKRLTSLRRSLDNDPASNSRHLVCVVDGSYTNRTVLKALPERTTLIGRIRKDAILYYVPSPARASSRGRTPFYGERAPTPQDLLKDASIPYQTVTAWAAGKTHTFKIKTLAPIRWRTAGQHHTLRLIVIAPLGYRLTKNGRILYRQPAYIICTDPHMPVEEILQYYLWRWDIEVNLRDEKHLLGASEAMVRDRRSVETVPAFIIFVYALLLLSARRIGGRDETIPDALPLPKWRNHDIRHRPSTQQLINLLRAELWGKSLGVKHFSGFVEHTRADTKSEKCHPHLSSAILYVNA